MSRLLVAASVATVVASVANADVNATASNETVATASNETVSDVSGGNQTVTYLTDVTKFCYDKLIQDSGCCLDSGLEAAIGTKTLHREGTQWKCEKPTCNDKAPKAKGETTRGGDALWWPENADCSTTRILYTHGGSFTGGGPYEWGYDTLGSKLAKMTNAVVMVPDYPLMKVGNFHNITEWELTALLWLKDHGPDAVDCSGHDTPPIVLGGDSAGGGSTLSVLLSAHAAAPGKGYPKIVGTFVYSPWTNLASDTPTYYTNAFSESKSSSGRKVIEGDIVFESKPVKGTKDGAASGLEYVSGETSMLKDPIASPIYAGKEQLTGLTPIYMAVSGTEELTGDSVIFAQKATNHGVGVVLDIFPGMWHVFPMYADGCGSGQELWQGQLALRRTADFVEQAVARSRAGPTAPPVPSSTFVHYPHPDGKSPWVQPPTITFPTERPSQSLRR